MAELRLQLQTSLVSQIDTSQTNCLNEAPDHGLRDMLAKEKAHLESDADEQLLLNIAFLQAVKLFAIRFTTSENSADNAPKTVRIFADQADIGFDEAASQTPSQEFQLSKEQASGKELVLLRYVKFQKTNSVQVSRSRQGCNISETNCNTVDLRCGQSGRRRCHETRQAGNLRFDRRCDSTLDWPKSFRRVECTRQLGLCSLRNRSDLMRHDITERGTHRKGPSALDFASRRFKAPYTFQH